MAEQATRLAGPLSEVVDRYAGEEELGEEVAAALQTALLSMLVDGAPRPLLLVACCLPPAACRRARCHAGPAPSATAPPWLLLCSPRRRLVLLQLGASKRAKIHFAMPRSCSVLLCCPAGVAFEHRPAFQYRPAQCQSASACLQSCLPE